MNLRDDFLQGGGDLEDPNHGLAIIVACLAAALIEQGHQCGVAGPTTDELLEIPRRLGGHHLGEGGVLGDRGQRGRAALLHNAPLAFGRGLLHGTKLFNQPVAPLRGENCQRFDLTEVPEILYEAPEAMRALLAERICDALAHNTTQNAELPPLLLEELAGLFIDAQNQQGRKAQNERDYDQPEYFVLQAIRNHSTLMASGTLPCSRKVERASMWLVSRQGGRLVRNERP